MVSREILLAESLGAKVHIAHVSTLGSVELVRQAKRRGVAVTAETCPHYFAVTDDLVEGYGTATKVNPPLRTEADRRAVIAAIADGTIDCLATDHAPHTAEEKRQTFDAAPFGIVGLETALALTISELVRPGHLDLARALALWTERPRALFGLPEVTRCRTPAGRFALWGACPRVFHIRNRRIFLKKCAFPKKAHGFLIRNSQKSVILIGK
jgi:dihydroorotase